MAGGYRHTRTQDLSDRHIHGSVPGRISWLLYSREPQFSCLPTGLALSLQGLLLRAVPSSP
jgi:hypothetical protein